MLSGNWLSCKPAWPDCCAAVSVPVRSVTRASSAGNGICACAAGAEMIHIAARRHATFMGSLFSAPAAVWQVKVVAVAVGHDRAAIDAAAALHSGHERRARDGQLA